MKNITTDCNNDDNDDNDNIVSVLRNEVKRVVINWFHLQAKKQTNQKPKDGHLLSLSYRKIVNF